MSNICHSLSKQLPLGHTPDPGWVLTHTLVYPRLG
jgi:hypothetical protein